MTAPESADKTERATPETDLAVKWTAGIAARDMEGAWMAMIEFARDLERKLTAPLPESRTMTDSREDKDRRMATDTTLPWANNPGRTLHACVEGLALALEGYLPWPEDMQTPTVRALKALIKDHRDRADICVSMLEAARSSCPPTDRNAVLEEAAKAAESTQDALWTKWSHSGLEQFVLARNNVAASIRALKSAVPEYAPTTEGPK